MKTTRTLAAAIIIAMAGMEGGRGAGATETLKDGFQAIADVDLAFLLAQPKLPWRADPFVKRPGFAVVTVAQEKFVLSGIVWSAEQPMAVVNGKVVVKGDTVGERSVASIGKNYVVLNKGDSSIELVSPPLDSTPSKEKK